MPFLSFILNKLTQAFSSAFFDRFCCYFLIIKLSFISTFNALSIVSYKFFAASRAETCTFFIDHFSFHGARHVPLFTIFEFKPRFFNLNRDFWNQSRFFNLNENFDSKSWFLNLNRDFWIWIEIFKFKLRFLNLNRDFWI